MDFWSLDFWSTVKDISATALCALTAYRLAAEKSLSKVRRGISISAIFSSAAAKMGLSRLRGFPVTERTVDEVSLDGLGAQEESRMKDAKPPLWGADPYRLALEMALQGISVQEISRRTEIPRGEILLAVNFMKASRDRSTAGPLSWNRTEKLSGETPSLN